MLLLKNFKAAHEANVKYVCCNNTGENKIFKAFTNWKGWESSLSAPHLAHHSRTTMLNEKLKHCHVQVMMNGGKFVCFLRNGHWTEVINTGTLLENNSITSTWDLCPFQQFLSKEEKHPVHCNNLVKCV